MTLQSPTATLIPLFSSSELTGCGYPGLLDRKNRSDMCLRWESNTRLSACKASTLSTRPGSPLQTLLCSHSPNDVPYEPQLRYRLMLCSHSPNDVPHEPQLRYRLLLCSHSPDDVPPEPQRNVSIAAVRGAIEVTQSEYV